MNNLYKKINQNANEKYSEDLYRTNLKTQKSKSELSSIFNKNINQNGGCYEDYKICMKVLNAFNNNDFNLALSLIVKNIDINWTCQDDNGNTILHHLVLCYSSVKDCKVVLERLLANNLESIINTKNYKGETCMLLAVFNGLDSIARKLENAGANKYIEDNDGNYIVTDVSAKSDTSVKSDIKSSTQNYMPNIKSNISMLIAIPDDTDVLTSLDLNSLKNDKSFNIDQQNSDAFMEIIKENLKNLSKKQNDMSDVKSTTEDIISLLANKYNGKNSRNFFRKQANETNLPVNITNNLIVDSDKNSKLSLPDNFSPTSSNEVFNRTLSETSKASLPNTPKNKTLNKLTKDNMTDYSIEELTKFVNYLKENDLNKNNQKGGKNKIVGWRKLILHSDLEMGEDTSDNKSKKTHYKKKANENDDEDEDEDEDDDTESDEETDTEEEETESNEEDGNELKRLINSRKNELHTEVINTIMEMLNKGEITHKNKPIEANERNAKLIKSFLYKQVSEKNPQLTGMDKILIIQKMNKSELLTHLKKLPDLDQLEKTIEEHIKNKHMQRESEKTSDSNTKENNKNKSKKKSESENESESD
jgi:hypothetical protein